MKRLRTDGIAWETAKDCTVSVADGKIRTALALQGHTVAELINGDRKHCNLPFTPVIFRLVQSPYDPTKAIGTLKIQTSEKEALWKAETEYDPYFRKLSTKLKNMAYGAPDREIDVDDPRNIAQHHLEWLMYSLGIMRYEYTRIGGLG